MFRWYGVHRVSISCFAFPDSFSAVQWALGTVLIFCASDSFSAIPRVSSPVSMFCAPGLIFGGTEGVGSHFQFLRIRTCFWRYRGHRAPFSCLALPNSSLAVLRSMCTVFFLCAHGHVFGGPEDDRSNFNVLRSLTHFRRYRGRRIPFSCFALLDLFFDGSEGVESRFHVLRVRTHFRRYQGRPVPFSYFSLPDMF
jgi:hypothetical protein